MKAIPIIVALFWGAVVSTDAAAQFNLRTLPAVPTAGAPFSVAFDDTECEIFIVDSPNAPTITVQGSVVRVAVDFLDVFDCSAMDFTHTLSVPALPQGTYQVELVGRAFQAPSNTAVLQVVALEVGAAQVFAGPTSIPAVSPLALLLLAATLGAVTAWRSRTGGER